MPTLPSPKKQSEILQGGFIRKDVACNTSMGTPPKNITPKNGEEYPEKFGNKYRIKSARLQGYDYSSNGAYFITICTANREYSFGEIHDGKMELSTIGEIANNCWKHIPEHFPFIILGESIVMPNHVHGIIIVDKSPVETLHATSLPRQRKQNYHGKNPELSESSPYKYSLSSIVRSYKSAVSKDSRETNPLFAWQTRFHDHIIRNETEFKKISEYIRYNPKKWEDDCYF